MGLGVGFGHFPTESGTPRDSDQRFKVGHEGYFIGFIFKKWALERFLGFLDLFYKGLESSPILYTQNPIQNLQGTIFITFSLCQLPKPLYNLASDIHLAGRQDTSLRRVEELCDLARRTKPSALLRKSWNSLTKRRCGA